MPRCVSTISKNPLADLNERRACRQSCFVFRPLFKGDPPVSLAW